MVIADCLVAFVSEEMDDVGIPQVLWKFPFGPEHAEEVSKFVYKSLAASFEHFWGQSVGARSFASLHLLDGSHGLF